MTELLNFLILPIICFLAIYASIKLFFLAFSGPVLNFFMKKIHARVINAKEVLFKEAFSNIKTDNKSEKLEILEIGIGTGENFRHFPPNSNLTILDKTDKFLKYIKDSLIKHNRQDLNVSKLIVSQGEDMNQVESNSMDAIVHTFILCSVNNYDSVLKEIYRILKPGGIAIFMEHSIDNNHLWRRIIQKSIEPLLGDCHYRDIRKIVDSGVYDKLSIKNYHMDSTLFDFVNPIIYGYGQKLKN